MSAISGHGQCASVLPARPGPAAEGLRRWLWLPPSAFERVCSLETWAVSLFLILFLHIGAAPYLAFALAGSFFCHCYLERSLSRALAAVLAGLTYAAASLLFLPAFRPYTGLSLGMAGAFCGCGSLGVLAVELQCAPPETRVRLKETLLTAALVPALCSLSLWAVSQAALLTPASFDFALYRFDRALAVDTFAFARWWRARTALYDVSAFVYNALPLWVAVCLALLARRGSPRGFRAAVLAMGAAGFALYQVCPAAGPLYRFPCFPVCVPALEAVPAVAAPLHAPAMNAMPSLHFAWTLLCLYYLWPRGFPMRVFASLIALLTAAATLASGEHYLVDLMVAVPLSVAIRAAFCGEATLRRRFAVAGTGFALVLAWTCAARLPALASLMPSQAVTAAAASTAALSCLGIWVVARGAPHH